jgi:HK97 gp10 family phage protein
MWISQLPPARTMADSIKVQVRGLDGLTGDLEQFTQVIQGDVVISGVAAMARVLYDEARRYVPVKTGTLRDAIYRIFAKDRSTDTIKVYRISWNKKKAPHGHLIENGTMHAPAYPFIRPAFDHINDAIDAGKARMAERLEEVRGGK